MPLAESFAAHLAGLDLAPGRMLVAVSGGPDSLALLHLLRDSPAAGRFELVVAHADHGIHPDSSVVARRVEEAAAALGLPSVLGKLELGPAAGETRARRARHAWLAEVRRSERARWIALAHHADDQAETVLLRVLQGSGPAGLAAMAARRGPLVRPLLPFRGAELREYLTAHGISWWEDPANFGARALRSWLRQSVLPPLEDRLPQVVDHLNRAARHAGADRAAWQSVLRHWPGLDWSAGNDGASVGRVAWDALPEPVAVALLQAWALRSGTVVGPARARRAVAALRGAPTGARADLGKGRSLALGAARVHLVESAQVEPPPPLELAGARGESEWDGWHVRWGTEAAPGVQPRDGATAWFIPGRLVIRPWRAGDRIRPLRGRGSRLAVRCFQDAQVPRHDRSRWPLIETPDGLAWIAGVCRAELAVPAAGAAAVRVDVARA